MIKGFVFDLDGVITETADLHQAAWEKMAQTIGITLDHSIESKLRGAPRPTALEIILKSAGVENKYSQKEKQKLADLKNNIYVNSLKTLSEANILPNIKANIFFLKKQNVKIALASVSKNARLIVEKLKIIDLFDYIVDAGSIKHEKPNPEIFLTAAKGLKLDISEIIVVDDSELGMLTTRNNGIKSIGISVTGDYSFASTKDFTIDAIKKILKENK